MWPSKFQAYLADQLEKSRQEGRFRELKLRAISTGIDFYSNDYLGFGRKLLSSQWLDDISQPISMGATGSRLISGQYPQLEILEKDSARFFVAPATLFFPSGYLANLALLSSLGNRHTLFIYDAQCHVSLKDGMRLSLAEKTSFRHNDPEDLRKKLKMARQSHRIVVVEAIYSMAGDICPLNEIVQICQEENAEIIVDEAHSIGVMGNAGKGLVHTLGLEQKILARILTFGKALGCAGALVAGTETLRDFLINHAHSFIYSTAPVPIQTTLCQYQLKNLEDNPGKVAQLQQVINYWNKKITATPIRASNNKFSPVQFFQIIGNKRALVGAQKLQRSDIQVNAIRTPTVPKGNEGIRICLHAFNTEEEIDQLWSKLVEIEKYFGAQV